MVRKGTELPKVAEVIIRVQAPKEPEIPAAVCPTVRAAAASGNVCGSREPQRAVDCGLAARNLSTHPGPVASGRTEPPKVVETPLGTDRVQAQPPEEPKTTAAICPAHCATASSGSVSSSASSLCAVDARLASRIAAGHPGPLIRGGVVLPKVVEKTIAIIGVVVKPPEEPEVAAAVDPARRACAVSREISCSRGSQRAEDSSLATRAASAHPGPLLGGGIEHPEVVEVSCRIRGVASKEPEVAALIGPARCELAASGNVSGCRRSLRAVDARLTPSAATAYPSPLL